MARKNLDALFNKAFQGDPSQDASEESEVLAVAPVPEAVETVPQVAVEAPRVAAAMTDDALSEPVNESSSPARKSRPPRRRPTSPAPTVPASAEAGERETATRGVPVHLTEELNGRLQAYMARKNWSHQTVLLDAIEATYTRLPNLIRAATAGEDDVVERTPLFKRAGRPVPKTPEEARVKHTIRMSQSNRSTLDRITEELDAPSRNFLITVAYEAYLPPIEKSKS